MKRVIVTGANGFVGSNTVAILIEQGWFVYAVDVVFDNPAVSLWDQNSIELITASCVDLPRLKADALIHGAFITASPEARDESPEANLRANIEPMLAMMTYAREQGIQRSIYLSSSGVYRQLPDTRISEDHPVNPLGVYAVAKTFMENLVETMRTVYQQDVICIRLGNIYGQYEYQRASRPYLSLIGQMIHMARTTGTIDIQHPEEAREWTYASDIGRALHVLLQQEHLNYALYHVASGERLSNLSIAQMIQTIMTGVNIHKVTGEATTAPLTRLGILDHARLLADTGFDDWTSFSRDVLAIIVNDELRSEADA
ncbi:MAG: NAD-dependent epimerase/dehydratase family protein [Anaerolineae bacterium]